MENTNQVESSLMKEEFAAKKLASLGNVVRLKIFRLLVKHGYSGLPVGEVQKLMGIPGSTLSHHIGKLVQDELIVQQRAGVVLLCKVNMSVYEELIDFLRYECCSL